MKYPYTALFVLLICFAALSCPAFGGGKDSPPADFALKPCLPVAGEPVVIRLPEGAAEAALPKGTLVVVDSDGTAVRLEPEAGDSGTQFVWTPEQTGYFQLRWEPAFGSGVLRCEVPVVWQPLYFITYPEITPAEADRYPLLASTVLTRSAKNRQFWKKRGNRVLSPVNYRRKRDLKPELGDEENVAALVSKWGEPLERGADGIWIDELTAYPDEAGLWAIRIENRALQALRERYPDKTLSTAVGGHILRESATGHKAAGALVTSEFYGEFHGAAHGTHSLEKHLALRIEAMRGTDLLFERGYKIEDLPPSKWRQHGGIILLSTNYVGGGIYEEPAVDRMVHFVRLIKQMAPEMPGIGFWSHARTKETLVSSGFYRTAEELVRKYYVDPVIDVGAVFFGVERARAGESVPVSFELRNVGGMKSGAFTVRVYARGQGGGTELIGSVVVDGLDVGFGFLHNFAETTDTVAAFGNTYVLPPRSKAVVQKSRQTHTVNWQPQQEGYYEIIVEADPDISATLLNGRSVVTVAVAGGRKVVAANAATDAAP